MSTDIEAVEIMRQADRNRARSKSGFGPSGFYGCPRATAYQLQGTPKCHDDADHWEAIVGTAVHEAYAKVREARGEIAEVRLVDGPMRGSADHATLIQADEYLLIEDLKTKKRYSISALRKAYEQDGVAGLPPGHYAQVNWYCRASGAKRWRLVYVPRDAPARYSWQVEGDYDPDAVDRAMAWLAEILMTVFVRGELPLPAPPWKDGKDPHAKCRTYCDWFDASDTQGCSGPPKPPLLGGLFTPPAA